MFPALIILLFQALALAHQDELSCQQLLLHPCCSLQCLWELGKATFQDVYSSSRESLRQERNPAMSLAGGCVER